jgi:hypothetical protein
MAIDIHKNSTFILNDLTVTGILSAPNLSIENLSATGEINCRDLIVENDLTVKGNTTQLDTIIVSTSSLSIDTNSSETALKILQRGSGNILLVEDENPENTPFIIKDDGKVGIGTSTPNKELTVSGEISSNNIIYALNGNSNNWNSVYSDVVTNSADWNSVYSDVVTNSADWNSVYSTVSSKSATEWDNQLAKDYSHQNFLPLSGGTLTGDLSGLSGLYIGQGSVDLIVTQDGNVGINTSTPNQKLTVSGIISSNNTIYDLNGNSNNWNSTTLTVSSLSSTWQPYWTQLGLDMDGEAVSDWSGISVSLNAAGDTVAIGSDNNDGVNGSNSGHVRVYKFISGSWVQQGLDIDGEFTGDDSGRSVSLNAAGDTVAIGAYGNNGVNGTNSGHVRVYKFINGSWVKQGQDIDGEAANDWSGYSVSLNAAGDTVAIGAYTNDGNGSTSGHVRVYKLISGSWVQQGQDLDGEAVADLSGQSVSINASGDTVAIGAPNNDGNGISSGHVRVYKLISGSWVQQGLDIDGEAIGDQSGWSVSLNAAGDTVAIGANLNDGNGNDSGHVRVYKFISGSWVKQGQDIDGEATGDGSGRSVSLNAAGDTVAIGARNNDGNGNSSGHVRVYKLISGSWVQQGLDLDGEAAGDASGYSVSLNAAGDTVAIGAINNDGNGTDSGHVRVYTLNPSYISKSYDSYLSTSGGTLSGTLNVTNGNILSGGTDLLNIFGTGVDTGVRSLTSDWNSTTLTVSSLSSTWQPYWTQLGLDIDGEAAENFSGQSVSLNAAGDTVAIGAFANDGNGASSGHVRVYKFISGSWQQQGQDIDGEAADDWSGWSVSLNAAGDTVAIGAPNNDGNGTSSGHVRVYKLISGSWIQQGSDIDGEAALDFSGFSVSLNDAGDTVAIGANLNDGNGASSGHVRVYKFISGSWVKQGQDIDGEATGDQSGYSVSLNDAGDTVAIGANLNDGNGSTSGHVRVYKFISGSWVQQGLDIDGEAVSDLSGISVSLNAAGDTVAIGATNNNGNGTDSGHVRVYKFISGSWVQQGQDIDGETFNDQSGYSVSLNASGDTVAIGAVGNDGNGTDSGHVRVYKLISGSWVKQGLDIDGEAAFDESGYSVSLNAAGDTVAIGATVNDGNGFDSGHVRVYTINPSYISKSYDSYLSTSGGTLSGTLNVTNGQILSGGTNLLNIFGTGIDTGVRTLTSTWNSTTLTVSSLSSTWQPYWTQLGLDIDGEAIDDQSGYSVSLNAAGDTVAIGANLNDGNGSGSGHVRVYKFISGSWVKQGQDIDGEAVGDSSGGSVSLNAAGDTVAIGAIFNDGNGSSSGHVRVYKFINNSWVKLGLDIDGEAVGDYSGYSVSLNSAGDTVAIGAYGNDGNGNESGHVRVYKFISGSWQKQGDDIDGEAASDQSGWSVSLNASGDTVAIGAILNNGVNGTASGHVRVYKFISGSWVQQGQDIDGEDDIDISGYSVSLNAAGDTVAIGAVANDGNGTDSGHVRVYKFISGSWVKQGQDIDGEAVGDRSGTSVSLNVYGDTVAIGASVNAGNGFNSGHVRVYKFISGSWQKQGDDIDGEGVDDNSGYSVSLNAAGDTVAIGARLNNGVNGSNSGHVRVYTINPSYISKSYDSYLSINGGTLSGTLNVTNGNILSGGTDLLNIFGTGVDTGVRSLTSDWDKTYTTVRDYSANNWDNTSVVKTLTSLVPNSSSVNNMVMMSQTNYTDLIIKDPQTLYIIV